MQRELLVQSKLGIDLMYLKNNGLLLLLLLSRFSRVQLCATP